MKLIVASATAALVLIGLGPAHADFHPACRADQIGAIASVSLVQNGTDFVFSGQVTCLGADQVTIDTLTLAGAPVGVQSAPSVSCTDCTETLTTSGIAPAADGVYVLAMTFTASDAEGGTFRPRRIMRYVVLDGIVTAVGPTEE